MPHTLRAGLPVELRTVDDYAKDVITYLKEVHTAVQRVKIETVERDENTMAGALSHELHVGDNVFARREKVPDRERKGPTRFHERVYDGIYVIVKKVSPTTFVVEDLVDKSFDPPFLQPLHAERLVKLDMPELELRPDQPRRVEIRERETQLFNMWKIERFGSDGRVFVRLDGAAADDMSSGEWIDLTRCAYR